MKLELIDEVAVLRLEAGKANAMNEAFLLRLNQLLDELEAGGARAAVIVGAGTAFSAGLDLPSLQSLDRAALATFIGGFEATMVRVFRLSRPVVAAINGHAIAGGCVLALQADVRIASDVALRIGLSEVALGIGLPQVVLESLRCQVPPASLVPIALEGKLCSPAEALRLGLVDEVVPADALLHRAVERARALGSGGAAAFAQIKRGLRGPSLDWIERRRGAEAEAWLDSWFSSEGQRRLAEAVARIGGRSRSS